MTIASESAEGPPPCRVTIHAANVSAAEATKLDNALARAKVPSAQWNVHPFYIDYCFRPGAEVQQLVDPVFVFLNSHKALIVAGGIYVAKSRGMLCLISLRPGRSVTEGNARPESFCLDQMARLSGLWRSTTGKIWT
jgi:hypothetical protein